MRRAVAAVALVAALAGVACAPASSGQATRPQLRLLDSDPVTIRATGFKPREHVRVVVRAPNLVTRAMNAGPQGGFTVRFPGVSTSGCTGFSVTVTGADGSRASLKRPPGQCALP